MDEFGFYQIIIIKKMKTKKEINKKLCRLPFGLLS